MGREGRMGARRRFTESAGIEVPEDCSERYEKCIVLHANHRDDLEFQESIPKKRVLRKKQVETSYKGVEESFLVDSTPVKSKDFFFFYSTLH